MAKNSMWNGHYGDAESKRRRGYQRTADVSSAVSKAKYELERDKMLRDVAREWEPKPRVVDPRK